MNVPRNGIRWILIMIYTLLCILLAYVLLRSAYFNGMDIAYTADGGFRIQPRPLRIPDMMHSLAMALCALSLLSFCIVDMLSRFRSGRLHRTRLEAMLIWLVINTVWFFLIPPQSYGTVHYLLLRGISHARMSFFILDLIFALVTIAIGLTDVRNMPKG